MARTTTTASMPAREKTGSGRTGEQTASDLAFYSRAMKAPALLDAAERLAERPGANPGLTPSSWSPACSARSPPASPTAARPASAQPASPRSRRSRSSTSPICAA
jgi:hypothetical protein